MSKHVAIYVRVSTGQQDTAAQLPDLERWAKQQSDPVIWYTDKASGKTMDRPQWKKLEQALFDGRVCKVVCWRLDRLGRTAKGLTALFADLQERGVNLVSLRDGLDLSTPAGRLMAHVLASVAEYETEIRAERVQAGQRVAKSKGVKWGGSAKGRTTVATVQDEQVENIKRLHAEGTKIAKIARLTGLSRPTIYRHIPKAERRKCRS